MNATFKTLEQKGWKEGWKEGWKIGERKESAALIVRRLRSRFGSCPEHLEARVKGCPRRSIMRLLVDAAYQSESLEKFEETVDLLLGEKNE